MLLLVVTSSQILVHCCYSTANVFSSMQMMLEVHCCGLICILFPLVLESSASPSLPPLKCDCGFFIVYGVHVHVVNKAADTEDIKRLIWRNKKAVFLQKKKNTLFLKKMLYLQLLLILDPSTAAQSDMLELFLDNICNKNLVTPADYLKEYITPPLCFSFHFIISQNQQLTTSWQWSLNHCITVLIASASTCTKMILIIKSNK